MAIQNRRGAYADFDPAKMVAGEFAVVQTGDPGAEDGKAVYMAFSSGSVKRLATYEDMQQSIVNATGDIVQDIEAGIADDVSTAQQAAQQAQQAAASLVVDTGLDTAGAAADSKAAGDLAKDLVAPAYSTSATYEVGDLVTYAKKLYRCTTAISTAEAWTAAHWTAVTVSGELSWLSINSNNLYSRPISKYSFTNFENGYYDQQTGEKKSNAPYIRSVEKIPIANNILIEYCELPGGRVRSDYGIRFVYWDSFLNFLGITTQITSDAGMTTIPVNAAYLAIEIISRTSTAITINNAPAVIVNWFEYDAISDGEAFTNWLNHTLYSENNQRLTYSKNSAFSAESYRVNPDLRYIISELSNNDISNVYAWEYAEDGAYIGVSRIYNGTTGYVSFKPTENTAYIRLSVNFSGTYSDPGIVTLVCSDKDNILPSFGGYVDETQTDPDDVSKEISIKWDGLESVKVTGTMSPAWNVYSQRIYYSSSELPDGINAGDKLYISFDNKDLLEQNRGKLVVKSLCLAVMFFFNNSPNDRTTSQFVYDSVELDVPKNATGMQIMLRVQRGQSAITLNPDGTRTITYEYDIDAELANFVISSKNVTINILDKINRKNMPCFVSFIDDDAANDAFCARYFNACMHNGITGAYAVQTDLLNDTTTVSKMLEYEEQGMGMLTHCSIQTSIYRADSEARLKACIANLAKAKRKMIEYGFLTYNHFVIPYGTKSDDLRDIARYLGFESAISTSDNIMNRLTDDDRYYIKRFGYVPQSDYSTNANSDYNKVMKLIGDMVKLGAGWVVITTHFCDDWSGAEYRWTTYPYDTTLDSNGYEVGYTEFNDLVAAIKATGAKIVPYTVGVNYFHSGARG